MNNGIHLTKMAHQCHINDKEKTSNNVIHLTNMLIEVVTEYLDSDTLKHVMFTELRIGENKS